MPALHFTPESREIVRRFEGGCLESYTARGETLLVAHVAGTPKEMGRQYGGLVGDIVRRNAGRLVGLFSGAGIPEMLVQVLLDSCWLRMKPYAPVRYLEEMAAIAEGAVEAGFEVTLTDLERITVVTNLDMYKRDERLPAFLDEEALRILSESGLDLSAVFSGGDTPLSCTMFAAWGSRTVEGKMFSIRNLDWISQTGMHEDRLLTVYRPECRNAFVSIGYGGVIGCLAGMNEKGISLSEVGSFSASEELDGIPWIFMARQVLEESDSLEDAVSLIRVAKHTIGYNYLVADGDPDRFGTPEFRPRAAAFETNFECCEVFYEDDPKEQEASWTAPDGTKHRYGLPLKEAVMRADTAFGGCTRALQVSDDGPGEPENTGNPCGRDNEGSTYTDCHKPMYDMIRAYETGDEYVFPVRGSKVIEAGAPCRIGPGEMLNIAATVAHNTERLDENDWNVMSVAFAPTDLDFWVSYESCDAEGNWRNAPDSGYWRFNLNELIGPREEK